MDKQRWDGIGALFHEALALEPAERSAFLGRACDGDASLRAEVERLLNADQQVSAAYLDSPLTMLVTPPPPTHGEPTCDFPNANDGGADPWVGRRVDPYLIQKKIGEGGMGAVYQARDTKLGREVALKTLSSRLANDDDARARFLREARAAAALEHDHVVAIYHVDEVDGVPFLVMPFLHGQSLEDRLKAGPPLPTAEVLRIGREIADGLAAAHEHGLIHRDVKPGNIWLEGPRRRVKLLDFGLARVVEESDVHLTDSGAIMGTPAYMAPEQANGDKVDRRCDLFSLGVVLYRMATGQPPFAGDTKVQLFAALIRDDPAPRALNPDLPAPVAALILHLLAKAPADRPQTARAVVEAIEKIERERPMVVFDGLEVESSDSIQAVATPNRPRRKSFPRPGKRFVLLGLLALCLFSTAAYLFAGQIIRVATDMGELIIETSDETVQVIVQQNGKMVTIVDETTGHKVELKSGSYDVKLFRSPEALNLSTNHFSLRRGRKEIVKVFLKPKTVAATSETPPAPTTEFAEVRQAPDWPLGTYDPDFPGLVPAPTSLPSVFRWQIATRQPLPVAGGVIWRPDGTLIVLGCADQLVRSYDAETLRLLRVWPASVSVANPNGSWVGLKQRGIMRFWDLMNDRAGAKDDGPACGGIRAVSPDGKRVAIPGGGVVGIWNLSDQTPVAGPILKHEVGAWTVVFSPDGRTIATGGIDDHSVRLWDAETGEPGRIFKGHTKAITSLAYSADGRWVASASDDCTARLWDSAEGTSGPILAGHDSSVLTLAFSPNGEHLVTGSLDYSARIWNLPEGKPGAVFRGHPHYVFSVDFSPDGRHVVSSSFDGSVRIWNADTGVEERILDWQRFLINTVAFSPDGRTIVSCGECPHSPRRFRRWNVTDGTVGPEISSDVFGDFFAMSPDGGHLAYSPRNPSIHIWDLAHNHFLLALEGHTEGVSALAYSPSGQRLASGSFDKSVKLWDIATGRTVYTLKGHTEALLAVAFSPNGRLLASGGNDGTVRLWDATTGKSLRVLSDHTTRVTALAFSLDGRTLISGADGGMVRFWEVASGKPQESLSVDQLVPSLAFSPDGRQLAAASVRDVKIWDFPERKERFALQGHKDMVRSIGYSRDGRSLVSGSGNSTIRLWDARTGAPLRVIVPSGASRWITISAAGRLQANDPETEANAVYLIQETENGPIALLSPAEFRERFGKVLPTPVEMAPIRP